MAPHTDHRTRRRATKGVLIGLLAVGTLLVVGPANGSPDATPQPRLGTHTPTKANPPATHQPALGTHTPALTPGARTVTHQPVG